MPLEQKDPKGSQANPFQRGEYIFTRGSGGVVRVWMVVEGGTPVEMKPVNEE